MQWLLLIVSVLSFRHAIYVSVSELTYKGNSEWELSCRLFGNDLGDALFNYSGERPDLSSTEKIQQSAQLIGRYINSKLLISTKDKAVCQLEWIGGTAENESVWAQFRFRASELSSVENKLLTELFPSQQNVVTVVDQTGKKRYLRFSVENTRQDL